ncbi:precorrin-2 dehydrogenase / sirohydrochlorin ferrochelatase [Selenomonas sp. GACV-9]|uniref:precorrin-2 dehydrogenase/sirohydrochlorin ferrochelatase family protein n=1 Tax=Selenomonas sp. GACV-9 TaxID=3158782 RepID=UPI0008E02A5C|nr:precorrin-2 dehydrogenase / sirohydrochlorin ferrochelatase [Selenomonas ruminantium]
MLYPLNLDLSAKSCVIIGGGRVAERKAQGLLAAGARVTVIAPAVTAGLQQLAESKLLRWQLQEYRAGMLAEHKPLLVFCTADVPAVNQQAAQEARKIGALVNAAAQPEITDFQVPSRVQRGQLLLTVSTGGGSPAFSRLLRERLEQEYPENFARFLDWLAELRDEIKDMPGGSDAHQRLWRQVLDQHVIDLVRAGELSQAEDEIRHGITDAGIEP